MANGLFSRNAQVIGPQQAMANVGRGLARMAEPALGMMGMQSEEQAVLNIMRGVDPTDLTSVKQGFRDILEINPAAAAEYRAQMMPFVQSQQAQLQQETSLIKAKAGLISAISKSDPTAADEEKIYDNLMSEYNTNFCKGGGIIGGECKIPTMNKQMEQRLVRAGFADEEGKPYLPSREQFVSSFYGQRALDIYKRRTGQVVDNTKPIDVNSVETDSNKVDDIPSLVQQALDKDIPKQEIIKALKEMNLSDEEIQNRFPQLYGDNNLTSKVAKQAANLVPEKRMGKEVMVEPTVFPQGTETYDVQQRLQEQEEDVLSSKFPGIFNY